MSRRDLARHPSVPNRFQNGTTRFPLTFSYFSAIIPPVSVATGRPAVFNPSFNPAKSCPCRTSGNRARLPRERHGRSKGKSNHCRTYENKVGGIPPRFAAPPSPRQPSRALCRPCALSPLDPILTESASAKSFVFHIYENTRVGVPLQPNAAAMSESNSEQFKVSRSDWR